MTPKLRAAFEQEMLQAKSLYHAANYPQCFHYLERAHILGQRFYIPHVINHYWMLKTGLRQHNIGEVFGQVLRIIGSVGSLVGWIPIGNTGGSNVSPIKPMTIPADLAHFFDE